MALTFLQLIQQAANEIGIPEPSLIIGATDDTSKQLLALAIREGKEFSQMANKNGGWQALHKEYMFTTAAITGLTGNLTSGSAIISNISDTAGIVAGTWAVSGSGIPASAYVLSIDSPTQVTMSTTAIVSGTAVGLSFGQIAYSLSADLEYFLTKTFWDGSYRWQLLGPLEAQEKNVIKFGISPVGPRRRFWILNNYLYINPLPGNSTDVIAYDYMSNAWCASSGGTTQKKWIADTDIYLLNEDCFVLGMKWRYLRAKGLDYAQEFDTYTKTSNRVMARDGGGRDLPLNATSQDIHLLNSSNVPDTGFGT